MSAIHLDACYVIQGLNPGHFAQANLTKWKANGEVLAVSAVAWAEFLCGAPGVPVANNLQAQWKAILTGGILPLDVGLSEKAANLFNATGRRSRSLQDCIIAATAIDAGARLATTNTADFTPFVPLGLILI